MTTRVDTLVEDLAFPVSPRWREGRLWFSDHAAGVVMAFDPVLGALNTVAEVVGLPAGLGFLPDGRLLIASTHDRLVLRREVDGTIVVHADLAGVTLRPLADVFVDAAGRAYVGSRGDDATPADLAMVEPDGTVHDVAVSLNCVGGIAGSVDGVGLTVAECRSVPPRLTTFTVAPDGSLEQERVFAEFAGAAVPEGVVADAAGGIWVASPPTSEVLRFDPAGVVTDRVSLDGPYSLALGGEDGRDLFVGVLPTLDPTTAIADAAGAVVRVRVEVPALRR